MKESPIQKWLQRQFEFRCRDCGSKAGLRSRSRTFGERYILPTFLIQPVRCENCFRPEYCSIFTHVPTCH
jgi:DNA-directed RNA polymerase subunit RPC12/RpoP